MVITTLVIIALGYLGLSRYQATQPPKLQPIRIRADQQTRRRR
jgi:hypothetical protein